MKNYSSNRAQKGKTAYRTPRRVAKSPVPKGQPWSGNLISRNWNRKVKHV
jgi:hypothetical protein